MDITFNRRFMLIFSPLGSLFDFTTFTVGTHQVFMCNRPSRAMLAVTVAVMLIPLVRPYSPPGGISGFTPLSILYLLVIFGIVALYFMPAELTKR